MDAFIKKVQDKRINKKYSLVRKLGEGGHGAVYLGRDFDTGEEVALKLEHNSLEISMLRNEEEAYEQFEGLVGFPELYWYGWHDDYRVMAFELLGPSLDDLFEFCNRQFSLKTTLMLADQLLVRLQDLHSREMVHRDIKPQNFIAGRGTNGNVIYIADFGIANMFYNRPEKLQPSPSHRLVGTAGFASVRAHEGRAQSPKDDLESLGYMLIHFMRGKLPWQGIRAYSTQELEHLIMEKKKIVGVKELCTGLPREFTHYMDYVNSLSHAEMPDYAKLRSLFRDLASREDVEYDYVFDWTVRLYFERSIRRE